MVTVDFIGDVFVTGRFAGTVDFDPGDGEDWYDAGIWYDPFLLKLLPDGYWQ